MIFTFKGYNTYIFDLDSKGKALVLKNGFLDLGDPATPDNLGLVRLENDKVIMELNNDSAELFSGQEGQTLLIENDDTIQIANNQLYLHLNYDTSGNLLGGEFILQKDEPTHTTLDNEEEDEEDSTDTSHKTTTSPIIATETVEASTLDDMPTLVDPPQKPAGRRLKGGVRHPGQRRKQSSEDSAADDSGDVFEKLDQFAHETSVIERTVYSDDDTPSDSGNDQDGSASPSSSDSSKARAKLEKLDQFARETSVIERTVYSDDEDDTPSDSDNDLDRSALHSGSSNRRGHETSTIERTVYSDDDDTPSDSSNDQDGSASPSSSDSSKARAKLEKLDQFARETSVIERTVYSDDDTPSDSGNDQDESASPSSSNSRRARAKLEKLDQFARETSVIERTVYSDDEEEDPLSDAPSDSNKEHGNGGSASGSSSDSRRVREKLEKLDQLARETSIIEHTSFSEIIDDADLRRDNKLKLVKTHRLLHIGAGFKKDILNGKYDYTVRKFIGQGGFAEVYKVEDIEGNPFALKVLRPDLVSDADHIYAMFSNEVSIGRSLSHNGLVRTLESGVDAEYKLRYCIMEFVDGKNLSHINSFFINKSFNLNYLYTTLIILKIAKVLDYLSEQGVVHRDIKLQNVMVDLAGNVKVLDLGIARQHHDTSPRKPNEPPGTFSYMPIGQLNRMDPVDVRQDIYSLGVLYFRLLTKQPPIPSPPAGEHPLKYYRRATAAIRDHSAIPDPRKKDRAVPDSVAAINMRMLEQDIGKRYASAKALIADLEKVVDENMKEKEVKAELGRLCSVIVEEEPYRAPKALPAPRSRAMRFAPYVALVLCLLIPAVSLPVIIRAVGGGYAKLEKLEELREHDKDSYDVIGLKKKLNEIIKQDIIKWPESNWMTWKNCLAQKEKIVDFQNELDAITPKPREKNIQKVWSSEERSIFKDLILPDIDTQSDNIKKEFQNIIQDFYTISRQLKELIGNLNDENKDDCLERTATYFNGIQFIYNHEKYLNDGQNLVDNNLTQFLNDKGIAILEGYFAHPKDIENDRNVFVTQIGKLGDILSILSNKETNKSDLRKCDDDMGQLQSMATEHSSNQEANQLQSSLDRKIGEVRVEINRRKILSDFNDIVDFRGSADELASNIGNSALSSPDISRMVNAIEKHYENASVIYRKYGDNSQFDENETEDWYKKARNAYGRLDLIHRTIIQIRAVEKQYNNAREKGRTIETLVKAKNNIKAKEEYNKLKTESFSDMMKLKEMKSGVFDYQKSDICDKFDKLLEDYHRTVITEDAELLKDYVEDLKNKVLEKMETDTEKHFGFLNLDFGKNAFDSRKYTAECKKIYENIEIIEKEKTNDPEKILEGKLNEARQIKDRIHGLAQDMDEQEIKTLLSTAKGLAKSMGNLESTLRIGVKELETSNGVAADQEVPDLDKIISFYEVQEEMIKEINAKLSGLGDKTRLEKMKRRHVHIPKEGWEAFFRDFGIMTQKAEEKENIIGGMHKQFVDLKKDYDAFQAECTKEFEKNLATGNLSMDSLAESFNTLNQNAKKLKNGLEHEPYKNVVKDIQKKAQNDKEMLEAVSVTSVKAHKLMDQLKAETTRYLNDNRKAPHADANRSLEATRKNIDDIYDMLKKEIINLKHSIGTDNATFSKKIDAFDKEGADIYNHIK